MTDAPLMEPRMPHSHRVVGILGGLGPLAGAHFYRRLIELAKAEDDKDHVGVILISRPEVPSRLDHLSGRGPSPEAALVKSALQLSRAGASLIAIPSSTTHAYYGAISEAVPIPVLHLPGIVMAEASRRGFRRVGLMATTPTVTLGLYEDVARERGITLVYPDHATQDEISLIVGAVKAGEDRPALGDRLHDLAGRPWARGVDAIVLGCTELPLVYPRHLRTARHIDASDELARECLRRAGCALKEA